MEIGGNLVGAIAVLSLTAMLTVIVTVLIWQGFALLRAKAGLVHEADYRALVEAAAEAQAKTAQELRTARVELAELRERVFSMDTLLREVG